MHTIKQNWTRWLILAAVAAAMFFGGLAIRLRITTDRVYVKGIGFLLMFLGIILFGTLLVVFSVKYLGHQKNKFHQ
jgi:hypothetical protein